MWKELTVWFYETPQIFSRPGKRKIVTRWESSAWDSNPRLPATFWTVEPGRTVRSRSSVVRTNNPKVAGSSPTEVRQTSENQSDHFSLSRCGKTWKNFIYEHYNSYHLWIALHSLSESTTSFTFAATSLISRTVNWRVALTNFNWHIFII